MPGTKLSTLIRGTLIAVNHANLTGNYTLLRDLGTLEFSYRNSASKLSDVFKSLRMQSINLEEIILIDPVLTENPVLEKDGILSLKGITEIDQYDILFDFKYKYELGHWRIMAISLNTKPKELSDSQTLNERLGLPLDQTLRGGLSVPIPTPRQ